MIDYHIKSLKHLFSYCYRILSINFKKFLRNNIIFYFIYKTITITNNLFSYFMSGLHQTLPFETRSAPVGSMVVGLDMLMWILFHNVLCLYGI